MAMNGNQKTTIEDATRPVVRMDGSRLWRIIVSTNEMTCVRCGEVFPASWDYCPRCVGKAIPGKIRFVPTLSYLRDGEYEIGNL